MAERPQQRGSRADAVRAAVDQIFQAGQAQVTRERDRAQRQAGGVLSELAQIATRARGTLDELRPPSGEAVRALREELRALELRVAALERESALERRVTALERQSAGPGPASRGERAAGGRAAGDG